jgi:hypothetical protein
MAKVRNTSKVKILSFNAWNSAYRVNLGLGWPLKLTVKAIRLHNLALNYAEVQSLAV